MPTRIPFVPFTLEKTAEYVKKIRGLTSDLLDYFPNLEANLIHARIQIDPRDYLGIILFSTIFWFVLGTGLMAAMVIIAGKPLLGQLDIVFMVSLPLTLMSFIYTLSYPLVRAKRRMRFLERDLLFALRHALIEVKSGVTLFNTMASIAKGGYGMVSEEFRRVVKEINVGTSEQKALERAAFENPSMPLRKVIWQISNALKAGSDVGVTLETLVNDFEEDQLLRIRKYGQEMSPWSMMYMMCAIILPTLGITFMIIMSSFVGGGGVGPEIFYLIMIFVVFFQVFFLSFLKTKRPMVGM